MHITWFQQLSLYNNYIFQTCSEHLHRFNRRNFLDLFFRPNQATRSTAYTTRDRIPLFRYDDVDHVFPGRHVIEFQFNCLPSRFSDQPRRRSMMSTSDASYVYLEFEFILVDRNGDEHGILNYLTEQYRVFVLPNEL